MKLRKSIILIVASCFGLLLAFLLISTRLLTYAKLNNLEDNHIEANLRRGINAISAITANLNLLASDWAYWDDTYTFLKDGNQGYINSNLLVETFKAQQNHLVVFFNREQELVWGKYLPPKGEQLVQLPKDLNQIFQAMLSDPQINRDGGGFSGLAALPQGLYSIVGKAVLTSNQQGPSTGWLIMGKALNDEVIEELQARTELRLSLRPIKSTARPDLPLAAAAPGRINPASPIIEKIPTSISCTGEIDGILAQPVAQLSVFAPREFYNSGVAAANQLLIIILSTGALAASLELEVTETAMMKDFDQAISSLKRFRTMGISISLDDFGTGYSSLKYLHNLPIQTLKIDKIFIDRIGSIEANTLELVKIIIALAGTMKVEVVAEGVETSQQRAILQNIGCLKAQGYLFAKPLPCHTFQRLLGEGKGKIILPVLPAA